MKLDILAFGAHPDDVELGCAGTLAKEISLGKTVGIIDLTQGELGTRGSAELRRQEAQEAARLLEVKVRENLCFADGFFVNDKEHLSGTDIFALMDIQLSDETTDLRTSSVTLSMIDISTMAREESSSVMLVSSVACAVSKPPMRMALLNRLGALRWSITISSGRTYAPISWSISLVS